MMEIAFDGLSTDGTYFYLQNACSAYTSQLVEFNFRLDVTG